MENCRVDDCQLSLYKAEAATLHDEIRKLRAAILALKEARAIPESNGWFDTYRRSRRSMQRATRWMG